MEAIGWILAIMLGVFVGAAWIALILELVGLPLGAAFGGVRKMLGRGRHSAPHGGGRSHLSEHRDPSMRA